MLKVGQSSLSYQSPFSLSAAFASLPKGNGASVLFSACIPAPCQLPARSDIAPVAVKISKAGRHPPGLGGGQSHFPLARTPGVVTVASELLSHDVPEAEAGNCRLPAQSPCWKNLLSLTAPACVVAPCLDSRWEPKALLFLGRAFCSVFVTNSLC